MVLPDGVSFHALVSVLPVSTVFRWPEQPQNESGSVPSPLLLSRTAILRPGTASSWYGYARFDPILSAKLVESRTHGLTTVFAKSVCTFRCRRIHAKWRVVNLACSCSGEARLHRIDLIREPTSVCPARVSCSESYRVQGKRTFNYDLALSRRDSRHPMFKNRVPKQLALYSRPPESTSKRTQASLRHIGFPRNVAEVCAELSLRKRTDSCRIRVLMPYGTT
jgi:hypothetical protein